MPVARISTSTSPSRGPSSRTVSMVSGAPARCATAARTSMKPLFRFAEWRILTSREGGCNGNAPGPRGDPRRPDRSHPAELDDGGALRMGGGSDLAEAALGHEADHALEHARPAVAHVIVA